MELVRRKGCAPRFPFDEFQKRQQVYDDSPNKGASESFEDLERVALGLSLQATEQGAAILGQIGAETAEKWLGWELGELYAVGYGGDVLFCIPGGTVVVPQSTGVLHPNKS
ncbi:MAG: hypothetical protein AB2556_23240 [Candidatus Thiodiazotropha sp.]